MCCRAYSRRSAHVRMVLERLTVLPSLHTDSSRYSRKRNVNESFRTRRRYLFCMYLSRKLKKKIHFYIKQSVTTITDSLMLSCLFTHHVELPVLHSNSDTSSYSYVKTQNAEILKREMRRVFRITAKYETNGRQFLNTTRIHALARLLALRIRTSH